SSNCANWLRHGITPKDAGSGLVPGQCASPAHDRGSLGLGGRCVLVSRQWSGMTLTETPRRPPRSRRPGPRRRRHHPIGRGPARRRPHHARRLTPIRMGRLRPRRGHLRRRHRPHAQAGAGLADAVRARQDRGHAARLSNLWTPIRHQTQRPEARRSWGWNFTS
ncbi:MAG: replication initiator, partial [Actinomycetales bacterium]